MRDVETGRTRGWARSGSSGTGLLLPALLLAQAMSSFDGSVTSVAAPAIRKDLATSAAELQLIAASYVLTFAGLVVTGSRLGQDRGYRRMFLTGLGGFTLTSVLCGVSLNGPMLIFARAGQGTAGALMVPQVLSLIQVTYEGAARARAVAFYSAVLAVGVGAGQLLGGLVVSADLLGLTWRPVFLLNVPVAVVVLSMTRSLPETARTAHRLDLRGAAMLTAAMSLLLVPLVFGRQLGWPAWTWACMALAGVAGVLFVSHEKRLLAANGEPLLDVGLLRLPSLARALGSVCAVMAGYAGLLFCLTLELQDHEGFSAARAGLAIAAYPLGFGSMSLLASRLPNRLRERLPLVAPLVLASAGGAVLLLLAADGWHPLACSVLLAIAGAGQAAAFGPTVASALARLVPSQAASASALLSTGSVLAQAIGVALIGDAYLSRAEGSPASASEGLVAAAVVMCLPLLASAFMGRRLRNVGPGDVAQGSPAADAAR